MFNYYNNVIFGWELRAVRLYWSDKLVKAAGTCAFKTVNGAVQYPLVIKLSFKMLAYRNEYEVTNVLVHEMLHALLIQRGIFESKPHGPIWMSEAENINRCYGLNIMQVYLPIDAVDQYLEDLEARKNNKSLVTQWQISLAQIPLQQTQQIDDSEMNVIDISSDDTDCSDVYSI